MKPSIKVVRFHGGQDDLENLLNAMLEKGFSLHGLMDALEGPGKWLLFKKG